MKKQHLEIPDAVRKAWPLHPEVLVQIACRFCSKISLQSGDVCVNAKSLLGVIAFEPECRSILLITADGKDEDQALVAVCAFFLHEGIISKTDAERKKPIQDSFSRGG